MAGQHLVADKFTSGPAPTVHAGLNSQICRVTMSETASASLTIALTPLPAGAEVTNITIYHSNAELTKTGDGLVSVFANINDPLTSYGSAQYQFIASASASVSVVRANVGGDFGTKISASANLYASYTQLGTADTGTGSITITAVVDYLRNKRGD